MKSNFSEFKSQNAGNPNHMFSRLLNLNNPSDLAELTNAFREEQIDIRYINYVNGLSNNELHKLVKHAYEQKVPQLRSVCNTQIESNLDPIISAFKKEAQTIPFKTLINPLAYDQYEASHFGVEHEPYYWAQYEAHHYTQYVRGLTNDDLHVLCELTNGKEPNLNLLCHIQIILNFNLLISSFTAEMATTVFEPFRLPLDYSQYEIHHYTKYVVGLTNKDLHFLLINVATPKRIPELVELCNARIATMICGKTQSEIAYNLCAP